MNFKLTNLPPEAKCALYRVITGEVEVPQLSVDVRYELGKVGFVKPAFGHTPDDSTNSIDRSSSNGLN